MIQTTTSLATNFLLLANLEEVLLSILSMMLLILMAVLSFIIRAVVVLTQMRSEAELRDKTLESCVKRLDEHSSILTNQETRVEDLQTKYVNMGRIVIRLSRRLEKTETKLKSNEGET